MTLTRQLLLVGALTLLIPLVAIQFVVELEEGLRAQELERLGDQAQRLAQHLEESGQLPETGSGRTLLAEQFSRRLILDGYGDDWPQRPGEDGIPLLYPAGDQLYWRLASRDDGLWLFVEARDMAPVFVPRDDSPARDRLVLHWQPPGDAIREQFIEARAPGRVMVRSEANAPPGRSLIDGYWQSRSRGFTVELRLPPLPPGSRFGFHLERLQDGSRERLGQLGLADGRPGTHLLPLLISEQPALSDGLAPFLAPGQQLALISPAGWELARAEADPAAPETDIDRFSPLELLQKMVLQGLRLALKSHQAAGELLATEGGRWRGPAFDSLPLQGGGDQPVARLTHRGDGEPQLTVIVPVGSGSQTMWLVSRRSTDALLSLSSTTLGQVLARSLLLTMALLLVLVGYASWLSWRIARLRNAVSAAVDSEGRVTGELEASAARDELGELSRHFGRLVSQVRGYTQYLETFARKLGHELKTPLGVMRSSLDNLRHSDPDPRQRVYIDRAITGVERLGRIITAMSEATRLERSLTRTRPELFDLNAVLQSVAAGYQSLDPRVDYELPGQPCPISGAPDLLVQALDKLLENARDFTPAEGRIRLTLAAHPQGYQLSVCNDGPLLPEDMAGHLFDSFVSVRDPGGNSGHLGQGLVIVKLVAEFHQGRAHASNRPDGKGVCFYLSLPAASPLPVENQ